MVKGKSFIDSSILFLSFVLLIFQTFTFLQNYYSFYITVGLAAIVFALYAFKRGGYVPVFKNLPVIAFAFVLLLILFIGVFYKGDSVITLLGGYLPYIIWPWMLYVVNDTLDVKSSKRYIFLFLIFYFISVFASLSVLLVDSGASRLLAGSASISERVAYYSRGLGGYGFVFGSVFILYGVLNWVEVLKSGILKFIIIICVVIGYIMILFASYTTAVLLALISIMLYAYSKIRNPVVKLLFFIGVLAIFLFRVYIFMGFANIGHALNLPWIEDRFTQLVNAESTDSMDQLKRYGLYMKSLESFAQNPILGGTSVGGHSMVCDLLGKFGIVGAGLAASIFGIIHHTMKKIHSRSRWVLILICALMLIDTIDGMMFLPLVLFVLPLMLISVEKNNDAKLEEQL